MRRVSGDGGVVAVLVALVSVVLFGLGALVVDVGSWYAEGRQLQNGAQAAAVAVAQGCIAYATCDPSTSETATAGTYAGANATDARAAVTSVCGTAPGLAACPAVPSRADNYDCQPLPSTTTAPYVEVRTETLTAAGQQRLPPLLVRALQPANTGKTVRACARASYGAPAGVRSKLPLTVSMCEFLAHTGGTLPPTLLAPAGPYPPWPSSYEKILYFHDTTEAGPTDCPASSSGMDDPLSGGFGWLQSDSCEAISDNGDWYYADPGSAAPKDCAVAALRALVGKVVDIPVFVDMNGLSGANGAYLMGTPAAFVLTGFYLGGSYKERSAITNQYPCGSAPTTGSQRCISGFFTSNPTAGGGIVTGPSNGVTVIQITG